MPPLQRNLQRSLESARGQLEWRAHSGPTQRQLQRAGGGAALAPHSAALLALTSVMLSKRCSLDR